MGGTPSKVLRSETLLHLNSNQVGVSLIWKISRLATSGFSFFHVCSTKLKEIKAEFSLLLVAVLEATGHQR